jgi:predicted DNA-binding ribbon-helix-helix protein
MNEFILSILFVLIFTGGIYIGRLFSKDKYLKYQKYWNSLRLNNGKYRTSHEIAEIRHLSVDSLMNGIEEKIDRNYNND